MNDRLLRAAGAEAKRTFRIATVDVAKGWKTEAGQRSASRETTVVTATEELRQKRSKPRRELRKYGGSAPRFVATYRDTPLTISVCPNWTGTRCYLGNEQQI
jgi:hypothetical protein